MQLVEQIHMLAETFHKSLEDECGSTLKDYTLKLEHSVDADHRVDVNLTVQCDPTHQHDLQFEVDL